MQKILSSRLIRLTFCAFLVFTILACATARIDVDVYKGPLANHEDVQIEQMSVMAVGARPLLIQLRNMLEGKDRIKDLTDSGQYTDRAIGNDIAGRMLLKDPEALRVNAILSLYEDRISTTGLSVIISEALDSLYEYDKAYSEFKQVGKKDNQKLWIYLKKKSYFPIDNAHFWNVPDNYPIQNKKKLMLKKNDDIRKALMELFNFYSNYIDPKDPQWRIRSKGKPKTDSSDDIVVIHNKLYEAAKSGLDIKRIKQLKTDNLFEEVKIEQKKFSPANSIFKALTDKDLVKFHAEFLFPDTEKEARQLFTDEVKRIAVNFLKARENLRNLYHSILKALKTADTGRKYLPPERARIKKAAIDIILRLTNTNHLKMSLGLAKERKDQGNLEGLKLPQFGGHLEKPDVYG